MCQHFGGCEIWNLILSKAESWKKWVFFSAYEKLKDIVEIHGFQQFAWSH